MADVKEWKCDDPHCAVDWVCLDTGFTFTECPFCETNKPPRPGGLKPIRPNPGG